MLVSQHTHSDVIWCTEEMVSGKVYFFVANISWSQFRFPTILLLFFASAMLQPIISTFGYSSEKQAYCFQVYLKRYYILAATIGADWRE